LKRATLILSVGAVLLAAACSSTNSPEAPEPESSQPAAAGGTAAAITAADLEVRLTAFAHDSMMGRQVGTPGNVLATDYIAAEVERLGLEPAGDDGTYFQTLPLVRRVLDESSSVAVGGKTLALGTGYLPARSLGRFLPFGMAGSLDGAQVIYGGLASEALSLTPDQVAGKLVLLGTPVGSDGQPNFQNWSADVIRTYESAAGIAVTALELLPPRWRRFIEQPRDRLGGGSLPEGPLGMFVTVETAELLLGRSLDDASAGAQGETIEGTFRFVEKPATYPARNVVAIVRGSDPTLAGEYVAIGSHNDHVGFSSTPLDHDSLWAFNHVVRPQGAESRRREPTVDEQARIDAIRDSLAEIRPARLDSIYNGADDDGSGSIAMLEMAEAFARSSQKPARSILFVWHTGEEVGLYGARYFTDEPTVPRESIVANLNIDMIGRGSEGDIENGGPGYMQLIGSRRLSTELGDLVEAVNVAGGMGFEFDYEFDSDGHPDNYYCRSDHYMYARYGIPIVFFSTGSHQDYHQLTDEAQYIDYPKMTRVTQLIHDIAETVADLDHRVVVDKPKPDPNAPCRQ
jgi:hypothetical protein